MALTGTTVMAQGDPNYDEESLLGTWVASGYIMEIGSGASGPVAVEYLTLNANHDSYVSWTSPYTGYSASVAYTTFFLSNGNKIHLVPQMPTQWSSLTFVITSLDYNKDTGYGTMLLRPLGDKDMVYCFVRQSWPNKVASIPLDSRSSEDKFDLSGMKTKNPAGPYIQNGKKYVRKK